LPGVFLNLYVVITAGIIAFPINSEVVPQTSVNDFKQVSSLCRFEENRYAVAKRFGSKPLSNVGG
jgi:hypothetical protein